MAFSGFRINATKLRTKFKRAKNRITANAFDRELRRFVSRSLTTAVKLTPERSRSDITAAQRTQYANRINYIPDIHTLNADPMLIVRGKKHWLYTDGKWYRADEWWLPTHVYAIWQELNDERERRMQTGRAEFIAERAQARFLYARSWMEVAQSIGVSITVTSKVRTAHSRHNPPKAPPQGYAQKRGGLHVLAYVIRNPFLQQSSAYLDWSPESVLDKAMAEHSQSFGIEIKDRYERLLSASFR